MDVDTEIARLNEVARDPTVSQAQRDTARAARDQLQDDAILVAWARIEDRGAAYDNLLARLTRIVDDISANRLTTAIDDINRVLADVKKPESTT